MKVFLYPNLGKTNCGEYTVEACNVLRSCGIEYSVSKKYKEVFADVHGMNFGSTEECMDNADIIIAIGGDGTILKCAGRASKLKTPILGINCGRLGFMASLEHSQLHLLRNLTDGNYTISRRMMLKASASGGEEIYTALNDVVVSRSDDCKISDFEVIKDDQTVSLLRANGVIFSTATGATAYSMSAGGPIIEPEMECIEFTQICPHSLFARSMIFKSDSQITVRCHTADNAHVHLNVDGNIVYRLSDGDEINISRADESLDIIDISGGSFFSSVNSKLMRPLKDTEG
ncbi:NAD(+)/NADH kinase [Ruminococcus sp.]|uniref:NAD(+)/NADH kinase n=1 Tax=Ruminococcus sp. TaxID=41978 RepID=UPI001B2153F0|nr:NAD(+)/NADH kinase [Ruminococcus sp.]MBO5559610.1 NAD(+)/NADH kinase [Ruminococcus sp.]